MIRTSIVLLFLFATAPALAQEPVGCDKFKWSLDRERALLANPSPVASGAELTPSLDAAVKMALVPFVDAKLPAPPSRLPKKPDSYAGFISVPYLQKPGMYRISLSKGAWIEVLQNGHQVKSVASSGATGCDGIRKSVKFDLTTAPFTIELSDTTENSIAIVVTPD
ncbi:MAG TPA: hypothetical protein VKD19_00795 [Pseudolabrys sp.]|nr:hypothetical protein [Pseudolabrys sp.]